MAASSRKHRRSSDGEFPAYFTRHTTDSVGWPFIIALVGIIVLALVVAVLMA